jgi:hypothetical protein
MSAHQVANTLPHHQPLPFRPTSPTPEQNHWCNLRHHLSSSRSQIAREQLLFGNARVKPAAVEEAVEKLRQSEDSHHARVQANAKDQNEIATAMPPDIEATDSYGWPGIGDWPSSKEVAKVDDKNASDKAAKTDEGSSDNGDCGGHEL